MSWHCSQALVAAFSEDTCLDGEPSAQSSSTPMPETYYWPDKTTEHSRLSRFGMTSEPLMADRGAELLMSFRAAFPVKTSASQEKATVLTGNDQGSGQKWRGWFAKYDRDLFSWKTAQCSLLGGLDQFSETWPQWGLMRDGECWELMTLMPHIEENEFGFWATPTTMDSLPPKSAEALHREATVTRPGRSKPANLRDQVSNHQTWPTPVASMSKGSSQATLVRKSGRSRKSDRLDHAVMASDGGHLNPNWVEWLMGWPIGWTDLKPLETDKFRQWQQQHGIYCQESEAA